MLQRTVAACAATSPRPDVGPERGRAVPLGKAVREALAVVARSRTATAQGGPHGRR